MIDQFIQAKQDAQKAVSTFLPSLVGNSSPQPTPPPLPSHPILDDGMSEAVRALSLAGKAEQVSARVARGLPPEPPSPPPPEEQFGPELDPVHIRALSNAVASVPETQRAPLLAEAHDALVRWIGSHNGKVVLDGKMLLARTPDQAETLAGKILNDAIDSHDQRQAQSKADEVAQASGPPGQGDAGRLVTPQGIAAAADTAVHPRLAPVVQSATGSAQVGADDPASGRMVVQPTDDPAQNQALATSGAPNLEQGLKSALVNVPGAWFAGMREAKNPDRLAEKIHDEGQPPATVSDYTGAQVSVNTPEARKAAVDAIRSTFPILKEKDNFTAGDPETGYRAHMLQVQLPTGASAEIQVVPSDVLKANREQHGDYVAGRKAKIAGDDKKADASMSRAKDANDAAMDEFEDKNAEDPHQKIRAALRSAGYDLQANPVSVGGRTFLPVGQSAADQSAPAADYSQPGSDADSQPAAPDTQDVSQPESTMPPQRFAKGDRVRLPDGSLGEVRYAHPNMDIVRVKGDDGNTNTYSGRDVDLAKDDDLDA